MRRGSFEACSVCLVRVERYEVKGRHVRRHDKQLHTVAQEQRLAEAKAALKKA